MKSRKKFCLLLKVCDETRRCNDQADRDADRAGDDAALHAADETERREEADQCRRDAQTAQRDALADRQKNGAEETQQNRRLTLSCCGDISLACV